MDIRIFDSHEALDKAASEVMVELARSKERPVFGLATGGTPVGIYQALIQVFSEERLSLKHALAFNLDEYVGLPPSHSQSYAYYMLQHLFGHVDMPPDQRHIPDGMARDPHQECLRYDQLLAEAGRIDLQLLGLGHNGHIGFNEPGRGLERGTHVVSLQEETREANARFFSEMEEVPKQAITMGMGTILQARMILLVVKGKDKADVLSSALTGPITTELPASLLQTHPHLLVMADREAGAQLFAQVDLNIIDKA
ncbi:glucosamine-6-phosphate deaminase [Marinicrinis sediminis]|uniref:Glucosamine-6-phosphate deaminase n=1 Tax=Marinicrinis sediminis TaxID=1652465 RepID=A0ABW5RE02_9BACL